MAEAQNERFGRGFEVISHMYIYYIISIRERDCLEIAVQLYTREQNP
jgi:hypothetical protein